MRQETAHNSPNRLDLIPWINDLPPDAWDAFMEQDPAGHLLQTWDWGEFKAEFGWQPLRIALEKGDRIVAAAQVLLRRLPLGTLAYIPKGPVLDPTDSVVFRRLMAIIHQATSRHHAFLIKAEPDWLDTSDARNRLAEFGFRPSSWTIQPRHTLLIDLTKDEETIIGAMKSKTRYNIRLAARKGVQVKEGEAQDLDTFYHLMQLTGNRDEFGIHSRDYYVSVWKRFAHRDRARLFLAVYEGKILAGIMVFACGRRAWYMYGASADEQRNLMPNHLLQWEAICWAKRRGCHTYDLWGIPDLDLAVLEAAVAEDKPPSSPPPPLWGVYKFKRGFGGQDVRYVGAYDYPCRPALYRLFMWISRWRKGAGG